MITTLAMSALLFAQAGSMAINDEPETTDTLDVAYETLASGEAREAVQTLEALRAENPGEPAILINLGAAYAATGQAEQAAAAYREAIESDIRYRLELADGRWVDSRRAAREALRNLEGAQLALN